MKFFVRQLPNGKILVKNTDLGSIVQSQIFSDMKDACDFMQNTIDTYGSSVIDTEDPTGIEAILGDE